MEDQNVLPPASYTKAEKSQQHSYKDTLKYILNLFIFIRLYCNCVDDNNKIKV